MARAAVDGRRRRVALALLGLLHIGVGVRLAILAPERGSVDAAIWHELLPLGVRVGLWVGAGTALVALVLASHTGAWIIRQHKGSPPPSGMGGSKAAHWAQKAEGAAWVIAMAMPVERVGSYGWSGLMWIIPGWPPGAVTSFGGFFFWLAVAGLTFLMSGWTESTKGGP